MTFVRNLSRLLRHPKFRKLVGIRALTQCADGTLQVGMASHILFNPAQQPNAWAIAGMFAITLLPFSIIGPFVSSLLDHWPRRTITVVVDATRFLLALVIAGIVASGSTAPVVSTILFGCLMVALALNRFVLAGLAAGLQHTIDDHEFLSASAVMPMIGPLGVLVGGGLAATIRLASPWSIALADATIFCSAAAMWAGSALIASRLGRMDLGPLVPAPRTRFSQTAAALRDAGRHLAERRPALLGLATITGQRVLYGLTLVSVLVLFRNHLHAATDVSGAMADIGLWMGASGVGFTLSILLVPPLAHRLGMRATIVALLLASAAMQLGPGQVLSRWPLVGASFFIGWFAQSVKICIDTVVQAHVDEQVKGRVFVLYDGIFNAAIVLAAVIAAAAIPASGVSRTLMVLIGLGYLVLASAFWLGSRPMGSDEFNQGTDLALH
ncbi:MULTISPECIES: MFS transporter [unclassified Luteococcus]|uniref:MFS transporter n=1 Tax=unclassified Luteococcus TaxID=2639923 RepID=UPI00313B7F9F